MASSPAKLAYDRAWRVRNRERVNNCIRVWRAGRNWKQYMRDSHIRRKYGLTPAQYADLLTQQGSRCASCGGADPKHKHGWQVDHDHTTGRVRGILCCPCNLALHVVEKPQLVQQLQQYLERTQ